MTSPFSNRVRERIGTATMVGVLFAIGMVVFALPSTSHAAGAQRCMNMGAFEAVGVHGFFEADATSSRDWSGESVAQESTAQESTEQIGANASVQLDAASPCGLDASDDEDADPSSNLCFEAVEERISTLPRFIAQWRGEQEAAMVVDSILRALDNGADEAEPPRESAHQMGTSLVALSIQVNPGGDSPADDRLMCTSQHPEQCQALPPMSESMQFAAAAGIPVPRQTPAPIAPELPRDIRPRTDLRVGPQAGHQRVPERPPRA